MRSSARFCHFANPEKTQPFNLRSYEPWVPGRSFQLKSWKRTVFFRPDNFHSWDSDDFFSARISSNLIFEGQSYRTLWLKGICHLSKLGKRWGDSLQLLSIWFYPTSRHFEMLRIWGGGGGDSKKKQIHRKELAGSWRKVVKKVVEKRPFHQSGVENQPDTIPRTVASRSTA